MIDQLSALIASGRIIDAILGMLVIECAVLIVIGRRIGLSRPAVLVVSLLLPGAFLMIAIRLALTDAEPWAIASALVAALLAHVLDVCQRFRSAVT